MRRAKRRSPAALFVENARSFERLGIQCDPGARADVRRLQPPLELAHGLGTRTRRQRRSSARRADAAVRRAPRAALARTMPTFSSMARAVPDAHRPVRRRQDTANVPVRSFTSPAPGARRHTGSASALAPCFSRARIAGPFASLQTLRRFPRLARDAPRLLRARRRRAGSAGLSSPRRARPPFPPGAAHAPLGLFGRPPAAPDVRRSRSSSQR